MDADVDPWWRVRPPTSINGNLSQVLASVDSLQKAWAETVHETSPEFHESRRRSLRRHAIETGIIERLYDVDWGVTVALIAEGLSAEVAEREGGIDADALDTIRTQFDALAWLAEAAGEGVPLTAHLIRQLHDAICRNQSTFDALDQFNRAVSRPLRHGSWTELPNQARTRSGEVLSFAPPDQVDIEIERLVSYAAELATMHPVVGAAWLHHSFVAIHPFDDGNGRVARALTMLVLLRARYAPLVVDRSSREEYLTALEAANVGDLRDLVRLFARLEVVALRAELERPITTVSASGSGAVEVARSYVERLRVLHSERGRAAAELVAVLASDVNAHVASRLDTVGRELRDQFRALDPATAFAVYSAAPPDDRSRWWRAQIIATARRGGFYTNIGDGCWWSSLQLTVLGQRLRFVVVTQKVGHGETGVIATTVFAESVPIAAPQDGSPAPFLRLITPDDSDSVTMVGADSVDARREEVDDVVDRTLSAAIARFAESLA